MKTADIRKKSKNDLEGLLLARREDLKKYRIGVSSHKVKDVKVIKKTKREVARILTVLKEREQ